MIRNNILRYMLFVTVIVSTPTYAEQDDLVLYKGHDFALGVGAAIVKFDTKMKFTDKQSGNSVFLDPEGNLDLPDTSHVTTIYGPVSYTHLTLPTNVQQCRSRWSPYH